MSERARGQNGQNNEIPYPWEITSLCYVAWHAELFGQLSNVELRDHEGRDEDDILVDVHNLCGAHVGANSYANVDRDGFGKINEWGPKAVVV